MWLPPGWRRPACTCWSVGGTASAAARVHGAQAGVARRLPNSTCCRRVRSRPPLVAGRHPRPLGARLRRTQSPSSAAAGASGTWAASGWPLWRWRLMQTRPRTPVCAGSTAGEVVEAGRPLVEDARRRFERGRPRGAQIPRPGGCRLAGPRGGRVVAAARRGRPGAVGGRAEGVRIRLSVRGGPLPVAAGGDARRDGTSRGGDRARQAPSMPPPSSSVPRRWPSRSRGWLAGRALTSRWPRRPAARPASPDILTALEREVLALLADGRTNSQIGSRAVHQPEDGERPCVEPDCQARCHQPHGGRRAHIPARSPRWVAANNMTRQRTRNRITMTTSTTAMMAMVLVFTDASCPKVA